MKFALFALIAVVMADPKDPGSPCENYQSDCGGETECCGVATGGQICKDKDCKDFATDIPVPNFVVCNHKDTPAMFPLTQSSADGTQNIYMQFPGDKTKFTCLTAPANEAEAIFME